MNKILFTVDEQSAERLTELKDIYGLSYHEAIRRGLALLELQLQDNSMEELGRLLVKKNNLNKGE